MKTIRVFLAGACLFATARASALPEGAYHHSEILNIGGARIEVEISPEAPTVAPDLVIQWVTHAAQAISHYDGRFPVKKVKIDIFTGGNRAVGHGMSYGGKSITIQMGRRTQEQDLLDDWELTHEMVHLSFPGLDDDYNWMEEGLATYVEPIARSQIGLVSVDKYWKDLLWGLPKGLPQEGDKGLDRTHTWGRTYWGGALYWFLADLEIRERTGGRYTLRDSLRAILEAGGNATEEWELDRVLDIADRATGTHVLKELHDQQGLHPASTDLEALFERLGVREMDGRIIYNDRAPLAGIRQAMTR